MWVSQRGVSKRDRSQIWVWALPGKFGLLRRSFKAICRGAYDEREMLLDSVFQSSVGEMPQRTEPGGEWPPYCILSSLVGRGTPSLSDGEAVRVRSSFLMSHTEARQLVFWGWRKSGTFNPSQSMLA